MPREYFHHVVLNLTQYFWLSHVHKVSEAAVRHCHGFTCLPCTTHNHCTWGIETQIMVIIHRLYIPVLDFVNKGDVENSSEHLNQVDTTGSIKFTPITRWTYYVMALSVCPSVCQKTPFPRDNSKSLTAINLKPGIYHILPELAPGHLVIKMRGR